MFYEERTAVPASVEDLFAEYRADFQETVAQFGADRVAEETGLERSTVTAVTDGDLSGLSLSDAAAIQSLVEGTPDPETIVEMACDHLLLGMSAAVLDVDTVATEIEDDLDPKEVQQKLERRAPMSFEEYVRMQHFIVGRRR